MLQSAKSPTVFALQRAVVGALCFGSSRGPVLQYQRRLDGSRVSVENSYGTVAKRAAGLETATTIIIVKKY